MSRAANGVVTQSKRRRVRCPLNSSIDGVSNVQWQTLSPFSFVVFVFVFVFVYLVIYIICTNAKREMTSYYESLELPDNVLQANTSPFFR